MVKVPHLNNNNKYNNGFLERATYLPYWALKAPLWGNRGAHQAATDKPSQRGTRNTEKNFGGRGPIFRFFSFLRLIIFPGSSLFTSSSLKATEDPYIGSFFPPADFNNLLHIHISAVIFQFSLDSEKVQALAPYERTPYLCSDKFHSKISC